MKNVKIILLATFILLSCNKPHPDNSGNDVEVIKNIYAINACSYDSMSIPVFFENMVQNHMLDFYHLDSSGYIDFCKENGLRLEDSMNFKLYFTVKILHDLFTCKTASDCSRGDILNIPYVWHWIQPNPRHEIYLVDNGNLLSDSDPPAEFSRYNSYADIDRTPFLFLSELVAPEPKYFSASCDTFSTFGWCSEREMAFVCLMEILNYQGKVVAEGNHSWSEFIIPMHTQNGEIKNFKVTVDNTFNGFRWDEINANEIENWEVNQGNSSQANWYNQKAHSQNEKSRIYNFIVSKQAATRIENRVVKYLDEKINTPFQIK